MRNRFFLSLAFLFAFIPAANAQEVNRDCYNLVVDYAMYRDRFDAEAFSNLFTEDASLTVLGQSWEGRDSIGQRITELDSSGSIRHLMSSIRITAVSAERATGISYATIYTSAAGSSTVEGPAIIGEYHDDFVLTADGWKIEKRVLHSVFSYEDS